MKTAVGFLPIDSKSISLCDNISLKFSRDANNLTFCLKTERIEPLVSLGAIIVDEAFHNDTNYDVANNLITAQFNGKGAFPKYAVMNKFSVFSAYYNLISVDGVAFDWNAQKHVEMVGKKQVTSFATKDFDIEIMQFLDQKSNFTMARWRLLF